MNRFLSLAGAGAWAIATALLLPSPAHAQCEPPLGCPSEGNSLSPSAIMLVGHDGSGAPDPGGQFKVVLRLAHNPLANAVVRIQLQATDVTFCSSQQAGLVLHLPDAMEGITDATGTFTASLKGFGTGPASHVAGGPAAALILGNGVLVAQVNMMALDLDGSGGAGINDLSVWLTDFGSGLQYLRGDLDYSGSLGINDLSVWLTLYGKGLSSVGCSP